MNGWMSIFFLLLVTGSARAAEATITETETAIIVEYVGERPNSLSGKEKPAEESLKRQKQGSSAQAAGGGAAVIQTAPIVNDKYAGRRARRDD